MKRWTVISSVVSTLFVASILTFSLSTEIASAHGQACKGHHKDDMNCNGGGGDDGDTPLYTVTLTGAMSTVISTHDSWSVSSPEGKAIGFYRHIPGNVMTLNLSFFGSLDPIGMCFPGGVTPNLFAGALGSKNIKGGIKQAVAGFWFDGFNIGGDPVPYVLHLFGTFFNDGNWPGTNTLTMTDWRMSWASGDGEAAQTACLGEGLFPVDDPDTPGEDEADPVLIDVQTHADLGPH